MKAIHVMLLLAACSLAARANVSYNFTFTPSSGPYQPFTGTLDEPTFLTANAPGTSDTVSPAFTFTDGTTTWSFTQVVIASEGANQFCFTLGTSGITPNGCNGYTGLTASQGEIIIGFNLPGGQPPTSPSTFSAASQSFFGFTSGNSFASVNGTATLTLAAPEPAGFALAGVGLAALLLLRRRLTA
jgi:hypothetical protein